MSDLRAAFMFFLGRHEPFRDAAASEAFISVTERLVTALIMRNGDKPCLELFPAVTNHFVTPLK